MNCNPSEVYSLGFLYLDFNVRCFMRQSIQEKIGFVRLRTPPTIIFLLCKANTGISFVRDSVLRTEKLSKSDKRKLSGNQVLAWHS